MDVAPRYCEQELLERMIGLLSAVLFALVDRSMMNRLDLVVNCYVGVENLL